MKIEDRLEIRFEKRMEWAEEEKQLSKSIEIAKR